ncbi:hypothetical protein [Bacillus pretiosus]|uniref:hypothetical protein n=1 Tax=Bacillus pretiosus TaxID=2983392 RepID=UPI003D658E6C
MERMYTPGEIAKKLSVSVNTLRKKAIEAEERGHKFEKTDRGHRRYAKQELEMLFPSININESLNIEYKVPDENRIQMDMHSYSHEIKVIIEKELGLINEKIKKSEQVIIEHRKNIEENKLRKEGIENLLVSITKHLNNEE